MKQDSSLRKTKEWRTLFLSTGNITLADKINENGQRSTAAKEQGGQEVRIVDIPADAGAALGLFENLHGAPDGADFSTMLKEATSQYYGSPCRVFLERITEPGGIDEARSKLKAYMREFIEKLAIRQDASGQVKRVANRFSLVAAAGRLTTDWGILPWGEDEAFSGAKACFDSWLSERGGDGNSEDAAYRAKLITKIQQGINHFEIAGPLPPLPDGTTRHHNSAAIGDRWGYREWVQGEGWHLYIPGEIWRATICQGIPYQHGAKLMIEDDFMEQLAPDGRPKTHRLPNPDGSRRKIPERLYHIKPSLAGGPDSAREHDVF